ncbi:MAG: effector binding domain-containing protein [bacterium]
MEKYSHPAFQITGYKITTTNKDHQSGKDIMGAWKKFRSEKMSDLIEHKAYPSLHCVYFNYTNPKNADERGYDMLIGFLTEEGAVQTNSELTTIMIPAQDYAYVVVKGEMPKSLIEEWKKINAMPQTELNRSFGYDLDMYNEDRTECTVTVSVK